MMRVLVACEFSGVVRDAFAALGHEAMSCDLLPSDNPRGWHLLGDVRDVLHWGWDLMIAHPPCTHLAVSGARWFKDKAAEQAEALAFVRELMAAPIPRIALENPVSIISSRIRKPDQIIQPWQFGHGEVKATCLWLKNLPPLVPTNIVDGREARVHRMPPGPNRWKERSRTFTGIADAMAQQWGAAASRETCDCGDATMKERELREHATCSLCRQKIGHTGLPLFWAVRIERYGIDAAAVQRQQGLAMMLGGNGALALAMGPDEEMTMPMMDPVTLTVCERCAVSGNLPVAALAEVGEPAQVAPSKE